MTVRELKIQLRNVPDHYPVLVANAEGVTDAVDAKDDVFIVRSEDDATYTGWPMHSMVISSDRL